MISRTARFLLAVTILLFVNLPRATSGVKCPTDPGYLCFCRQATGAIGWDLDCPDAYRIEYAVQSFVSVECSGEAPYEAAMFEKLDITDVEVFKFKYCPLPNITFQELLRGMSVKMLKVEIEPNNQTITGGVFSGLDQLEELNLRGSHLVKVEEDVFQNLTSLKRLFLDDNELTELPAKIFQELPGLLSIQLASNMLETLPAEVFANLTKLQRLYLYNNRLEELPQGLFEGLISLQVLDLSKNRIRIVQPGMFQGVMQLVHLNLKSNNLEDIANDAFSSTTNLRELDLSDNPNVTSVPEELLSNLTMLKIFKMNSCKISYLPKAFFEKNQNLTNVTLYNNRLSSIDEDQFSNNSNLEELDLMYNNLTELPANLFRKTSKLKKLLLAVNHLRTIPNGLFDHMQSLMKLQLKENQLQLLDGDWFKHKELEELDVSKNEISDLLGQQPFGPNSKLKKIDLSFNNLTEIPSINWEFYINLEKINFKSNKIKILDAPTFLSNYVTIDLEDNQIETVLVNDITLHDEAQNLFYKKVQTRSEFLLKGNHFNCDCKLWKFVQYVNDPSDHSVRFPSANSLKCHYPETLRGIEVLEVTSVNFTCPVSVECPSNCDCKLRAVDRTTFMKCSNLTELPTAMPLNTTEVYLENNDLSSLDGLQEPLWENVTILNLDNNNLTAVEFTLSPYLKELSLAGNQFEWIPETLSNYVQSKQEFSLSLGGNPWFCDCSTLKFKDWLHDNAKKITDIDKLICQNDVYQNASNPNPMIIRLTDQLCPEDNEIDNAKLISVSIVCVILALLLFIVSVLYYRNKQTLTAYIYIHFYKVFVCFFNEEELDEDKAFDAFISYSSADREIAMSLIDELEKGGDPNFKLCIHERDWLPGNLISWNIVNSVQNSRKTILVLSKDFLESVWFQVEFHTAYYQMLEDRIDRLIVIVRGELPEKDSLDKDLQFLLSTKTYLEWGERWFWEKLRFALPHHKEGHPKSEKMALRQRPNKSLLKTVEQRLANLTVNGDVPELKSHTKSNGTTRIDIENRENENNVKNQTQNNNSTKILEELPSPPEDGLESEIVIGNVGSVNKGFVLTS